MNEEKSTNVHFHLLKNSAIYRRKKLIEIVKRNVKPGSGSGIEFLKSRTWRNPITDIKSIIKQTPFVIIGGVATRMYMVERRTDNLDILVQFKDAKNVEEELLTSDAKRIASLNFGGSCWQLADGSFLNVIYLNKPWVKDAVLNPNYNDTGLPIISLPYLVLSKIIASRYLDLGDISRMLGGANEEELQQTKEIIGLYLNGAVEDVEDLAWLGKLEYQDLSFV